MGSSYLYPSFFPLSRPTMTAKTLSRIAVKSCTSNMPTRGKWRNLKVNMGMELVPIYGQFHGKSMEISWEDGWKLKDMEVDDETVNFRGKSLTHPYFLSESTHRLAQGTYQNGKGCNIVPCLFMFRGNKNIPMFTLFTFFIFFLWLSEGSGCNDWKVPLLKSCNPSGISVPDNAAFAQKMTVLSKCCSALSSL